jgi:hypothetical protein
MQCSPRAVLAAFALALPALAYGQTNAPVRLVTPHASTTLAAGSTAEIEWAPVAGFAELQTSEEWEAFLSVDGGATYPVRITPHLDSDLRRFRFQVPPIPTAHARLLLRFGDERRETAFELPERFAITAAVALPEERFPSVRMAFTAGEPALPGHSGVVSWVEGSRRGGGLRLVVAAEAPGLYAQPSLCETDAESAVLDTPPAQAQEAVLGTGSATDPLVRCRPLPARAGSGPSLFVDILLLTQRQNE